MPARNAMPLQAEARTVIETMHRATAELIASGVGSRALKAGDTAPPFVLNDANGNAVASSALLAQGPLVVSFYRGVWCPYCNMELQALQEALPAFRALGAQLPGDLATKCREQPQVDARQRA